MAKFAQRGDWLIAYAAGTLVVMLGVVFGRAFVMPAPRHPAAAEAFLDSLVHWDATYYRDILQQGYSYDPGRQSTVHFFPLYPLVSWLVQALAGFSVAGALVVTSHVCFAAALGLVALYTDLRYGKENGGVRGATVMALGLMPAGMFFRMAYAESLFLLLCVLTLYLLERRAPVVLVAGVVGLATATRPVGVALLAPLLLYLVRSASDGRTLLGRAILCLPLSLSGLLAFMAYCQGRFGDALAFARQRTALWAMRPLPEFADKLLYLETFEPVWSIFVPSSSAYWGHHTTADQVVFSLYAANPLYFVAALGLLALGLRKGWLNASEVLLSLGLLLVPYGLQGYELQMQTMARYISVIVPLYLVLGQLLARLPTPVAVGIAALSSFFLAAYAALFVQWYWII